MTTSQVGVLKLPTRCAHKQLFSAQPVPSNSAALAAGTAINERLTQHFTLSCTRHQAVAGLRDAPPAVPKAKLQAAPADSDLGGGERGNRLPAQVTSQALDHGVTQG